MIISHKHKFIFIKTRKTAGSSISKILRDYLSPNDIADGDWYDNLKPLNVNYHRHSMEGHQKAKWISKKFPYEWKHYYKFTIERNPWQKAISAYRYYQQINLKNLPKNFTDFLKWEKNKWIPVDWNWYTNNNTVVVDSILAYHNLNKEFGELMNYLQIPYHDNIESTKLKQWNVKNLYSFTNEDNFLIESLFHNEISYFNYQFVEAA
mgnify:CR=1 FL=1